MKFTLALLLAVFASAQTRGVERGSQPPLLVSLQYMDAQGCANRNAVTRSNSCTQNVQVSLISHAKSHSFAIAISYTDQFGLHQVQGNIAQYEPSANPELPDITVASTFFVNVDDISDLQATVVADNGQVVTIRN